MKKKTLAMANGDVVIDNADVKVDVVKVDDVKANWKSENVKVNDKSSSALTPNDAQSPVTFSLPNLETFRIYDRASLIELAQACMMLAIYWKEV